MASRGAGGGGGVLLLALVLALAVVAGVVAQVTRIVQGFTPGPDNMLLTPTGRRLLEGRAELNPEGVLRLGAGGLEVAGPATLDGDVNVQGRIFFHNGGFSTAPDADNSDAYFMQKVDAGPNDSSLRITLLDDPDESLQVWGDACRTTGCGGPGVVAHRLAVDGSAWHRGKLCLGDTCIDQPALRQLLAGPPAARRVAVLGAYGMGPWGSQGSWPDAQAQWIWDRPGAASDAPGGVSVSMEAYYFNTGALLSATLHVMADNHADVYLNNRLVQQGVGGGWGSNAYPRVALSLPPGSNVLRLVCVNDGGPAGLVAALTEDASGRVLLHTDASWTLVSAQ
jgi:hypothetical protein